MNENTAKLLTALGDIAGRVIAPRLENGVASLLLDVSGLGAAERAALEEEARRRLLATAGVSEVRIMQTADKPSRKIIAVGSGKGGVGKSTLAANLAIALARAGKKVGLVDADIYGPSQHRIMGREDKPEAVDKQIIPLEAHGIRMLSIGQLVDSGTALAWRGPMASSALGQLLDGDWGDAELLVIDLPPGTGDVQITLLQKWKPAGAVIVSTPQDLALIDATRAIDLFRKLEVPIYGLVENMAGYACPHCGEVSDPFGAGGAEAAAARLGIPFLGRVPLRMSIREASDAGTPPAAGDGEESMIFAAIAARLLEQIAA
jgi:ATP-binding protein involved in chromosome partitioning